MSSETRNHWFVCLGWRQRYCFNVYKTLQFHGQFIALVLWLYLIYICVQLRAMLGNRAEKRPGWSYEERYFILRQSHKLRLTGT